MTDPNLIAAAVVTVLSTAAGLWMLIIKALTDAKKELLAQQFALAATAAQRGEARAASAKVDSDKIHDLVNGSATEAARKLAAVEAELVDLRKEFTRLQEQRVEDSKTREASTSRRRDDPKP